MRPRKPMYRVVISSWGRGRVSGWVSGRVSGQRGRAVGWGWMGGCTRPPGPTAPGRGRAISTASPRGPCTWQRLLPTTLVKGGGGAPPPGAGRPTVAWAPGLGGTGSLAAGSLPAALRAGGDMGAAKARAGLEPRAPPHPPRAGLGPALGLEPLGRPITWLSLPVLDSPLSPPGRNGHPIRRAGRMPATGRCPRPGPGPAPGPPGGG